MTSSRRLSDKFLEFRGSPMLAAEIWHSCMNNFVSGSDTRPAMHSPEQMCVTIMIARRTIVDTRDRWIDKGFTERSPFKSPPAMRDPHDPYDMYAAELHTATYAACMALINAFHM